MRQKAILFLEPFNHVLKVVESAHNKGFAPVAIHSVPLSAKPPYGHALSLLAACEQIPSWKEEGPILAAFEALYERFDIVGTYTAAEMTLPFESLVRKRLGLPHNDASVITDVLDKQKARTRLKAEHLSDLACYSQEEMAQWQGWPDGFVGYFKPVSGAGSAHVYRCASRAEFDHALGVWNARSEVSFPLLRDYINGRGAYFVEEAAPGELVSLESLLRDGELTVLGLTSRTVLESNPAVEMGACFPYAHPHLDKIIDKVTRIHAALGITHGPTHTEVMVTADGDVELVELNPRFVGADVLMVINAAYQRDIQDVLLALACGEPIPEFDKTPPRYAALQYFLAPEGESTFEKIEFPEGNIVFERVIPAAGAAMPQKKHQEGFIASFIAVGDDYPQLIRRVQAMRHETKVNGKVLGDQPSNLVVLR